MKKDKTVFFSAYGWSQINRELYKLSQEELTKLVQMAERLIKK